MIRVARHLSRSVDMHMSPRPVLKNRIARHIFLDRHALGSRHARDLAGLIARLSFVQLDSINTVARAHHMILHARQQSYRAPALDRMLAKRQAFEHWTHDASVIAIENFPHWRWKSMRDAERLKRSWKTHRREGFEEKSEAVLRRIADHGPCCSTDVGEDEARSSGGWWDWHPSKTALEYLWRSGELSVTRREGFRKYYDLTERVIPPEYLNARVARDEMIVHACHAALSRLGFATSGEIAAFWDMITPADAKTWCAEALRAGEIIEIDVEGADHQMQRCFALPDICEVAPPPDRVRILSPFDPALRDRKRSERLFGFHYRIEVFVPEAKRIYGYYVFPVLEKDRLIGRIDMKCDRKSSVLRIRKFWPERDVKWSAARRKRLVTALGNTARLAGSETLEFDTDWED